MHLRLFGKRLETFKPQNVGSVFISPRGKWGTVSVASLRMSPLDATTGNAQAPGSVCLDAAPQQTLLPHPAASHGMLEIGEAEGSLEFPAVSAA